MLPNVYEFSWDPYRVVFLSFFMGAACVIVLALVTAWWRSRGDVERGRAGHLRWHDDFAELPTERRLCRHTLGADAAPRVCEHAFDCGRCEHHVASEPAGSQTPVRIHGLTVDPDLGYHRGHTWVRDEGAGHASIGLSPLARRILPRGLAIEVPRVGEILHEGDAIFSLPGSAVRIVTPISGRVVEVREETGTPVLRLEGDRSELEWARLLRGTEAAQWMEFELRQLQTRLLGTEAASAWADGGAVVDDLARSVPEADWKSVREEFFLDV